tara:strand:+ start:688 stop:2370 length:1683 start_codon:yes stop_codon:yes gene_type:complete
MASLLGKADTTLVKAATDAAMANVPVDISRVHERISKAHAKMTTSVGKSWGVALKAIGEIGTALVQNARDKKDDTENFENNTDKPPTSPKDIKDITSGEIKSNLETKGLKLVDKDTKNPFAGSSTFGGDDPLGSSAGRTTIASMQESVDLLPKAPEALGWQALPTFDHVDTHDNTSTITVANTEQHVEALRDQIHGLSDARKTGLKDIDTEGAVEGWSKEEISLKKKNLKTFYKGEKRRLNRVKEATNNSNRRFAEFNEVLKSQLEGGTINMNASGMYGANKMNFANALLNKGTPLADGSKAVQGYDEKGNMTFMYVDKNNRPIKSGGKNLTLAEGDVGSLLVQESPLRPLVDGLIDLKNIRKDYKYGIGNFSTQIARTVDEKVKDKNTFLDLAFYQSENTDSSLADTLHDVKYNKDKTPILDREDPTDLAGAFITGLADMGNPEDYSKENPHPYDQDQDGDFDKDDYMTEKNYMAIVKKALSGDDLNFSKFLLKKHLELQTAGHLDEAFKKNNPVVPNSNDKKIDYKAMIGKEGSNDFPIEEEKVPVSTSGFAEGSDLA